MKQEKETIVKTFKGMQLQQLCKHPLIVVYKNPSDYQGKYIARLWDSNKRPTPYIMVEDDLEAIRAGIPEDMRRFEPEAGEDPVIHEIWVMVDERMTGMEKIQVAAVTDIQVGDTVVLTNGATVTIDKIRFIQEISGSRADRMVASWFTFHAEGMDWFMRDQIFYRVIPETDIQ